MYTVNRRVFFLDVDDDQVQPVPENQKDDEFDDGPDDEFDYEFADGFDDDVNDWAEAAELIAAAQEGTQPEKVLSILEEDPWLIRIGDPVGDTVVHIAARAGDVVTVRKLIAFIRERNDLDLERVFTDINVEGDTALHLALKNSHREVAYHLVKANNMAAFTYNNDEVSPFRLAREAGFSEVLSAMPQLVFEPSSALSDLEMDIAKRNLAGGRTRLSIRWDELYTAIVEGFQDVIVKELTSDGKELLLHQRDTGETLLHVAAAYDSVGPLRQLLKFMINNNLHHAALLRDGNGHTALHLAVVGGSLSAARYLIKAVPETLYKVDDNGVSPLNLAVEAGNKDLVIYMMSHCRLPACATEILAHHKHKTLAHLAITARSFGTLKTLMEHLPELIKMTDERGWSPLSFAANKGYLEEVTYFLTRFPRSATKCDRDGSFPIHKAISRGHVSIIKAFLAHCPQELYRVDKKGRSVLHIAVRYKGRAVDDDILAYLMKEVKMDEAFLNRQDNEGKTFRDHAN